MGEIVKAPPTGLSSALIPKSFEEAIRFCEFVSKSDLVPAEYRGKPANVFIALQYGMELGVSPFQAMQSIAIVNGKPQIYGDLAIGLVRASGLLVFIKETMAIDPVNGLTATCTTHRRGDPEPISNSFSEKDAKRAGLDSKAVHKQYPARMLQMRARGFNLRDVFPDVLKGLTIRDEFGETTPIPQVEIISTESAPEPQLEQPQAEVLDSEIVLPPVKDKKPTNDALETKFLEDIAAADTLEKLSVVQADVRKSGLKTINLIRAYVEREGALKKG